MADTTQQPCNHLAIEPGVREDATARLRSIRGHVDGVLRMLERDDVYCVDALKQIKAVQGALAKTGDLILRGHLKHHVVTAHERGDEDAIVAELMDVLKYR
ncbi:metal-sensitive transcriptional regulator [Salinisphaera sp. RV14]|uniref:metal-sensitive transcriptional regulator n=1 Tax=unclassified Salinisphaera TaxID=2649847 RepID=UPI000D7066FE|nr:metal-sensitive transcriptional regulator [Salinisphaera sp. LB1]AWN16765.1 putative cytosolic protein [Salinisphaera sp. LB1]